MKTMTRFCAAAAAVLITLSLPSPGGSQPWTRPRFESVRVEKQIPARPFVVRDEKGQAREYREAFVVHLKGHLPPPRDMALELFVGDWKVPEYGSTEDGLYFRIYDPELRKSLKGRDLRYRLGPQELQPLGLRLP